MLEYMAGPLARPYPALDALHMQLGLRSYQAVSTPLLQATGQDMLLSSDTCQLVDWLAAWLELGAWPAVAGYEWMGG